MQYWYFMLEYELYKIPMIICIRYNALTIYIVTTLCYVYFIVIYDGVCVEDMLDILCRDVLQTLMKT